MRITKIGICVPIELDHPRILKLEDVINEFGFFKACKNMFYFYFFAIFMKTFMQQ